MASSHLHLRDEEVEEYVIGRKLGDEIAPRPCLWCCDEAGARRQAGADENEKKHFLHAPRSPNIACLTLNATDGQGHAKDLPTPHCIPYRPLSRLIPHFGRPFVPTSPLPVSTCLKAPLWSDQNKIIIAGQVRCRANKGPPMRRLICKIPTGRANSQPSRRPTIKICNNPFWAAGASRRCIVGYLLRQAA